MQRVNSVPKMLTMVRVQHRIENRAVVAELVVVVVELAVEQVFVVGGQFQNLQANEDLKWRCRLTTM